MSENTQPAAGKPSVLSNRKYLYLAIIAIIAIVAIVLIVTSGGSSASGTQLAQFDDQPVPQQVLSQLQIPNSVASKVGTGFATNFPSSVNGKPLTLNGKPEILYIGAEYCPYCAVERWGLVMALMRFGNFTGLQYMTSSGSDVGPNTPTFTFVNATYSSPYISFVSRELTGNKPNASTGQYPTLQAMNASQTTISSKFDTQGSIPFVDYANKSVQVGANYNDPTILANMNWSTIAGRLNNSTTIQSQALVGSANLVTAQICALDNNTPSSVCSQSYITNIESQLS